ncbi:TonB-dependent receptor [Caulobacter sp. FWC26]|uniref:TonB-dependent receptor n=1 Tax=Caulobacter sp. FWC26 TaxID=69665 RepID=UPI000C15A489|nr:TonB-dependent receptor [Caulobacter sp. FWC26]AZS22310.1 TonB-dependent receptor [Caulobacter sp. FWC26]
MRNRLSIYGGCSATALAISLAATPVAAGERVREFNIAPGELSVALSTFARQANQEMMVPSALVAGRRTAGVQGRLEPRAALNALLKGTGLQPASDRGAVVTLGRTQAPSTAVSAPPVATARSASALLEKISYGQAAPVSQAVSDPPSDDSAPQVVEEVMVTGSRIVRDGYQAPTPTTVLGQEALESRAPTNVADYINQLPQMGQPTSPRTTTLSAGTTGGGANLLNARNLGPTRTLVLLDGRRVVSAGLNSAVDINLLPTNLLQRVDIVTGGASAAYGSDAVAGVVNFVLDTRFTGLKGSASAGVAEEGDSETYTADLAFGAKFAGGRGHLLLSGNYFDGKGVDSVMSRDWYQPGFRMIANPAWTATNGQPGRIVRNDIGYGRATPGGLITSGPLRGLMFGENAQVGQFTFGPIQSGDYQAGGTVEDIARIWPLLPPVKNWAVYGRASYELTDSVTAIFEASRGGSDASNWSSQYNRMANINVSIDNPFIPATVRQAMVANNLAGFTMGRLNYDLVTPGGHGGEAGYYRRQNRYLAALEGRFLETGKWSAYYQRGDSDVWYTRDNNPIVARYNQAIDVIANPAVGGVAGVPAGQAICRSQLSNASNGCVPLNIFGIGAPGIEAINWVLGVKEGLQARQDLDIQQDVWAIDAQYEPFSTWAGPVSIAAGFEYRKEQFTATADPLSLQSAWYTGNFSASQGSYTVKEVFGEALVPLIKDVPFFKSVDFNGAVRRTDYSTSGAVTTWKAGLTWEVNNDLRLRGTRSRDIRAPNLSDLFAAGTAFQNTFVDASQPGGPTVSTYTISGGNPNLAPEVAKTWTAGLVYRPHWLPGFSASVDWYKIEIGNAIVAIGAQQLINQCYGAGVQQDPASCASIIRVPGSRGIEGATIYIGGVNAQKQAVEGVDYEFSYRADLSSFSDSLRGSVDLRLLASNTLKNETALAGTLTDQLGLPGTMKWNGLLTGTYTYGPSRTTVSVRYLGGGRLSNFASTNAQGVADEINHFGSAAYVELAQNYDLKIAGRNVTVFSVVENLLDRDPNPIPGLFSVAYAFGTTSQYDLLGRAYRVGARFRF